jgi:hypothetical protein
MTYHLAEGIVTDVLTCLASYLPAKITAINAETTDFDLVNVANYYHSEQRAIDEYPSCIVRCNKGSVVIEHTTKIVGVYDILIGILHLETDSARLVQALQRYQRAIFEVLKANEGSLSMILLGYQFIESPLFAPTGSEYLADVQITVTVRRAET